MAHRDPTTSTGRGTASTGRGAQHRVCVRSNARLWWGHGGGSERAHRLGLLVLLGVVVPARCTAALLLRRHHLRPPQTNRRGQDGAHGRSELSCEGSYAHAREVIVFPTDSPSAIRQRRCQGVKGAARRLGSAPWGGRGVEAHRRGAPDGERRDKGRCGACGERA